LWHGTAESFIDLNPQGYFTSRAFGVSSETQVGIGYTTKTREVPGGGGRNLTGEGQRTITEDTRHALLWRGLPESVVDLHPTGFADSVAWAVEGQRQVGEVHPYEPDAGGMLRTRRAALWTGSADSFVDLHAFLAGLGPTFRESGAKAIAANGNIFGGANDIHGNAYAIMWVLVPEPSSFLLACCFLLNAVLRRWRET
jgi:hypothetical protein